ncbi:MAG: 50S ribosomal protein L29 [Candidatus Cloacimonadota bacterium]|nr:MAG: 50S ribosomal protein L29 [Candidatus Cloacimonadota bacterium]
MTGKEVREKTDEELLSMLHNLYEELFNLRIAKASANLTNPARFKQVRRDVARVKTVLNGRRRLAG